MAHDPKQGAGRAGSAHALPGDMLPIRDLNPTRTRPLLTWLIIALCVLVFGYEALLPEWAQQAFVYDWALVPARLSAGDPGAYLTVLTSMFLHGSVMHVVGNLWFLWIFGDNVEDAVGRARFALLYLVSGTVAALAQYLVAPDSPVPMLGASGAIGGVLGAYAALFPHARVLAFVPFYFGLVEVPALIFLGLWFAIQLLSGLGSVGVHQSGGVAFWAHVGGFVTGVVLGLLFRPRSHGVPQDHRIRGREAQDWYEPIDRGQRPSW